MKKENKTEINADGSVVGKTFSGDTYTGEHPTPKRGGETYRQYHERCRIAVEKGFHLGDLGWSAYTCYCKGSGYYDDFDADRTI